jgi:lysophospholipid acyltransferase (LPLAT)-like uncharacterized protein
VCVFRLDLIESQQAIAVRACWSNQNTLSPALRRTRTPYTSMASTQSCSNLAASSGEELSYAEVEEGEEEEEEEEEEGEEEEDETSTV